MHSRWFNLICHILQRHCNRISVSLCLRFRLRGHLHIIRLNKCQHFRVVTRASPRRFGLFGLGRLHFFHFLKVGGHEFLRFTVYLPVTDIGRSDRDHIWSLLGHSVIIVHAGGLGGGGVLGSKG